MEAAATEDAEPIRSTRRKACDLCFRKKIKCDMLKPICSNCRLYDAQCRTSMLRHKARVARPQLATQPRLGDSQPVAPIFTASTSSSNPSDQPDAIDARLARIERQLQQVLTTPALQQTRPQSASISENTSPQDDFNRNSSGNIAKTAATNAPAIVVHDTSCEVSPEDTSSVIESPTVCVMTHDESGQLRLPSRAKMLPIVEHYFDSFNAIVPIFHRPTFMRMFNDWYDCPSKQNKASWAAIQIAIALGLRVPRGGGFDSNSETAMANHCLRNAQSVVTELVTRDEDLLGIQVLLGIVFLFQNSSDPKPATVIIGTALRLTHRLELQALASQLYFSEEEVEQRSRVFWITYSLDKDISLRAKVPSGQLDADIDVPLPSLAPLDGVGLIWTLDTRHSFNYHRMRPELSFIEGKIFDLLYANRARNITQVEREQRVDRIDAMLEQWYQRVPAPFRIDNASSTLGSNELQMMTVLHYTFLMCQVQTHGIFSKGADWVQHIQAVNAAAIHDMTAYKGDTAARRYADTVLEGPKPDAWEKCVELSRGCMKLFQNTPATDSMIWQTSCPHFSGLIILLAHMLKNPTHALVPIDQLLASKAIILFNKILGMVNAEQPKLRALGGVINELMKQATLAVKESRVELTGERNDMFSHSSVEMYTFLENQGQQMFEDGGDGPFGLMDYGVPVEMDFDNIGAFSMTNLP
ncbi:hypothetical protein S40288_04368, partial [Stachybotrys chartarum IBT 40288]